MIHGFDLSKPGPQQLDRSVECRTLCSLLVTRVPMLEKREERAPLLTLTGGDNRIFITMTLDIGESSPGFRPPVSLVDYS